MRTVLFVCTGNTCRSPMAEAIARHHLDETLGERAREVFVASAGVGAGEGLATSHETISALADLGIEHDGRSKRLSAAMIRNADLILCMTAGQHSAAQALVANSPEDAAKIVRLDPDADIEDPVGMGQDAYDAVARRLTAVVPARLDEALTRFGAGPGAGGATKREDRRENRPGIRSSR